MLHFIQLKKKFSDLYDPIQLLIAEIPGRVTVKIHFPWKCVAWTLIFSLINLNAQFAKSDIDLDEFTSDLSGGIKKEKEKEKKTEPDQSGAEEFERIQVTGSHVKRMSLEGASPVQVLDRQAMEKSGYNSVSDVLRDLSANSFGSTREQSGSGAAGVATVSLRGMGSNKTLVLLNGKRLPMDAMIGSVDLNLIPMAAVQRIEVLKDGASATYGSDALGGVVNIITYKDYNGSEFSFQQNMVSQFEGGSSNQMAFITGSSTSKSSIVSVLNYRKNETFFSKDRPWTKDGISPIGSPGAYRVSGGKWQPASNCTTPLDQGDGDVTCAYNFAQFSTELPEIKQLSGMTLFEYETDYNVTLFGRLNASRKLVNWQYAPAPGVFSVDAGSSIAELGGQAGQIRYRTVDLGNREQDIETTAMGFQVGAKGNLSSKWDWELTLDQNRIRDMQIGVSGYALSSVLRQLIQSGEFNPLSGQGVDKLNQAFYQPWSSTTSDNLMYELKLTGELFNMPGGVAGAAVGVVYAEDAYTNKTDHLSETGQVFSNAGSSGAGSREASSAYMEFILPVTKNFEVQLAGRYDKFSDFGDTTNPKLGLRYDINPQLMLRASGGTGFMAPRLVQLYAARSFGFPTFTDAVACQHQKDTGVAGTPACRPQQYFVESGGNPNLKEEKSLSVNIGAVYQPSRRLKTSLDIWSTQLSNVVGIDYNQLMIAEKNGVNLAQHGVIVDRDPVTKRITDDKGITAPMLNLSRQEISGLDFQAMFRLDMGLYFSVDHSILFFFREEGFPGTGFRNSLGENGQPAWRNSFNVGYSKDKNNMNLLLRTVGSHSKFVPEDGKLPAYTEIDLSYNREIFSKTTLTLGVQNLLSTIPPLDESNANSKLSTSLYNPRGQVIFAAIKQGF